MSEWLGKMLGKVRIDSLLARGGIAEVYLGEHVALQREVAVKILRNQYEDDSQLLERFQREARVVAKLRHSNIVQVFDFDSTTDGRPYLVMEYVPGVSLSRYLHALHSRNGRLELPVISRIISQVAHALQYAHESGVIHRDVKPGNILLTSRSSMVTAGKPLPGDFEPILTDFGLVRFLNSSRQTTMGVIAGTPAYMSPEQARGEPTDERTDIYSLGIVLYELLAGHIPFDGETTMSIILKHVTEPPPPIPGLPIKFQSILNRALAKKPDNRFQTANELAEAFNQAIQDTAEPETVLETDEPKLTTHITSVGYKVNPKPKWRPYFLAGALVVLVGGFFVLREVIPPEAALPPTTTPAVSQPGIQITATPTITNTPTATPSPSAMIHFQDSDALLDEASLSALTIVIPPEASHYEVWLAGVGDWQSLGILLLDSAAQGNLQSQSPKGINFLSAYDKAFVTIELNSDTDTKPSDMIAYYAILPSEGLSHLRQLLVASKVTPKNISLIHGLNITIEAINQSARDMQSAYQRGNQSSTRRNAQKLLDLLTGTANNNFGLLSTNGKAAYIPAVLTETDSTISSKNATQSMIVHGEEVKVCAQNLSQWTSQLQNLATTIVNAPNGTDLSQPVIDSVKLADQLLNGLDTNNDKNIDPVAGECGMSSLYGYAYSMADMSLIPFIPGTVLETATSSVTGDSGSTVATAVPTQKPVGKPATNTPKPPNNPDPPGQKTKKP